MFKLLKKKLIKNDGFFDSKSKSDLNLEKFNSIMDFAHSVMAEINQVQICKDISTTSMKSHPLIDVIRVLGKSLQSQYLSYLLFSKDISHLPNINYWGEMFEIRYPLSEDNKMFSDLKIPINIEKEIYLSRDLILPWPWERTRLINSISHIGDGRLYGAWEQDTTNHNVELWLPIGVTWVGGGNHSIASGIIQGEGKIIPTYIFDISPIYKHVYCDGIYYRRKHDDSIISAVKNVEFAAIFEIGRIMVKNSITF